MTRIEVVVTVYNYVCLIHPSPERVQNTANVGFKAGVYQLIIAGASSDITVEFYRLEEYPPDFPKTEQRMRC